MGLKRVFLKLVDPLADLRRQFEEQIESLKESHAKSIELNREWERWIALWKQAYSPEFPRAKLWEEAEIGDSLMGRTENPIPLDATLDDLLQKWLWKRAWDACAETGNWDLLTAAAGIARAIRTEGVPMSPGLRATALPHQGSE
jgi:hypothetical protein